MEEITNTTNIHIVISHNCRDSKESACSRELLSVSRSIRVDGKVVYKDKMDPRVYMASSDPIKKLEEFLLGTEKSESGNDIGSNGDKPLADLLKQTCEETLARIEKYNKQLCEYMLYSNF